jgi:hypothetical protein
MKNYSLLILLITSSSIFAQVKNEPPYKEYKSLQNSLNKHIEMSNLSNSIKSVGFGVMGFSFISIYAQTQKMKKLDPLSDEYMRISGNANNEFLVAGVGALISCVGVLIPIKPLNRSNINSIQEISPLSAEINMKDGIINVKAINSVFKEGDEVSVKNINGPVILSGILSTIAVNRIEVSSDSRVFTLYLNQIEYIKLNIVK